MTWREAFYLQARADFGEFRRASSRSTLRPMCYQLHFLQMASEKLAKAYLCPIASPTQPKTIHATVVKFLRTSKSWPEIRRGLGYKQDYHAYCAYIDALLPVADQIEDLAPVGSDPFRANAEYPWLDPSGDVVCPVEQSFAQINTVQPIQFAQLVESLLRIFPYKG